MPCPTANRILAWLMASLALWGYLLAPAAMGCRACAARKASGRLRARGGLAIQPWCDAGDPATRGMSPPAIAPAERPALGRAFLPPPARPFVPAPAPAPERHRSDVLESPPRPFS